MHTYDDDTIPVVHNNLVEGFRCDRNNNRGRLDIAAHALLP